jgi:hypothetical protein
MLTFDAWAWPAKVSFQRSSGSHTAGHFRSLAHQENRVANDRFQSTADVARRPSTSTTSPMLSFIALRCQPASRADTLCLLVKRSDWPCRPIADSQSSSLSARKQSSRVIPAWREPRGRAFCILRLTDVLRTALALPPLIVAPIRLPVFFVSARGA